MRADGRGAGELRPVKITRGFVAYPEGSVLIEWGGNKILCCASVEEGVPPFLKGTGKGWITAEYSMLPRSNRTRTPRDIGKLKLSGRSAEIQRLIGRALRSVADLEALGERTITIDCDVLQADGGTRCASITGGFCALALALEGLRAEGLIASIPLREHVAAVSAGIVRGEAVCDLCYEEDSSGEADVNFVLSEGGDIIELQGTGEKRPFTKSELDSLYAMAEKATAELIKIQKTVIDISEK